jgi:hypothetical protein
LLTVSQIFIYEGGRGPKTRFPKDTRVGNLGEEEFGARHEARIEQRLLAAREKRQVPLRALRLRQLLLEPATRVLSEPQRLSPTVSAQGVQRSV